MTRRWPLAWLGLLVVLLWACDADVPAGPRAKGGESGPARTSSSRTAAPGQSQGLRPLFEAATGGISKAEAAAVLGRVQTPAKEAAVWPLHVFLRAEVERLAGDGARARTSYREIVDWAAHDPYGDGWGGNGLAIVALCRWLQLAQAGNHPGGTGSVDPAEARQVLGAAETLRATRLARGMTEPGLLESFPRLEEEVLRRLARLAWSAGEHEQARRRFLDYLAVATSDRLDPVDAAILQDLVTSGLASHDWLTLMRGKRLRDLGQYDRAFALVSEARRSGEREVRAEAGLVLASLELIRDERNKGVNRQRVATLLGSVIAEAGDPDVAQGALFARAILMNREGPGRDPGALAQDLATLIDEFPRGRRADDALYEVARHDEEQGNTAGALEYYARLRRFEGPNDWLDSAYFRPAMVLYTRRDPGDLAGAAALLEDLLARYPSSPFRAKALFWLGRIETERGAPDRGRTSLERVVAESPFDYYAIRARMWLTLGPRARTELWPDTTTDKALRAAFEVSRVDGTLPADSPYHVRLDEAIRTGVYALAAEAPSLLRQRSPGRRLEDLAPEELEPGGLLARVAVLLALGQDALAAKDARPTPENRLRVAGAVGQRAGQWSLALTLALASGDPPEAWAAAQRDPRYLATAYPPLFGPDIVGASERRHVPPEVLYGLVRTESLFSPTALSPRGALGLVQFTPTTFDALDRRWGLLRSSGAPSREAFLMTPRLALDLGARWVRDELLRRESGDVLLALMEHNAGYAAVRDWARDWQRLGRKDDVEYVVDSIRFAATSRFVRRVMAAAAITRAAGLLHGEREGR